MKYRLLILFYSIAFALPYNILGQNIEPTEKEALLEVTVRKKDGSSIDGQTILFVNKISGETFTGVTNDLGKFSILVPKGQTYNVKYKNFSDEFSYQTLDIPSSNELMSFEININIEPPKVFTLKNVNFDSGKTTLKYESYKALKELVDAMKLKKTLVIEIGGHTDNTGNSEKNLRLSEERAKVVRDYLIKHGIDAKRVSAKGYGDTKPIASNDTEEGRKKNRRTEVVILKGN
ncbi:MAG: OmpA family protein [Bacteroidota bacterium]|nr:OmpA family protein [Bacteroidota bacterium]